MKKYAIIVAGGQGTRMNTGMPKQFIPVGGLPMLAYSIKAFYKHDPSVEIIVVIPEGFSEQWQKLAAEAHLNIPHSLVHGGQERFYSVLNALNTMPPHEALVAVHDAARPFVSEWLIGSAYAHARQAGCAIPAVHLKDSIRVKIMDGWTMADRTLFRAVQTPQVFYLDKLKQAYQQSWNQKFTDDASVYENAGNSVYIIEGEDINFKITSAADLEYAEYLTENKKLS